MDSMRIGIECLLSDDWAEAHRLAMELDKLNKQRRSVESKMRDEADEILAGLAENSQSTISPTQPPPQGEELSSSKKELAEESAEGLENGKKSNLGLRKSLVLYQDDWHQGVIGIVAGRLKESHYCPAIVFAPADTAKVHFGGHAMAAGLTLQRSKFAEFAKAFDAVMAEIDDSVFTEEKFTDGQLMGQDFSLLFADTLKEANTWGHGFAPPMFDGVFEVLNFRVLKDKHLKLSLNYPEVQYPIDAIWFNYDSEGWDYQASRVHLLFELDINEWNGNANVQLMVRDLVVVAID